MQNSLFDLQNRYARLSEAGDPLERLNAVIDWEIFRPILDRIEPTRRGQDIHTKTPYKTIKNIVDF